MSPPAETADGAAVQPLAEPAQQRLAETVATQIGLALANLNLRESLRIQSLREPLTGLYNRYLAETMQREHALCVRNDTPLGVAAYPDHRKGWQEVAATADHALYTARKSGRNRVTIAPVPEAVSAA